jgi:site-specific DNA-methyltransferase (adenine-specific)/modification methylase
MCGDSTNPNDLGKLVDGQQPNLIYTDPPYGIAIVNKAGKVGGGLLAPVTTYMPVAGDDTTDAAADAFRLLMTEYPDARHVWWGGNHYTGSATLPDSSCWLIWDKETNGNFADAELAWTNHIGAVRLFRHMWNGMLRASEREKRVHPTQKPVALAEWAFSVVDPEHTHETVLDVFGGSGSTLLACHTTGRAGLLMEMEPAYIDVICRRYQQATGNKPILDSTGEAHDFTRPQGGGD